MSFYINKCKVYISFLFIITLGFSALWSADLLYVLLYSSLHEFGHLIALYLCKGKATSLTFSYYGFALRYDDVLTKSKELIVIISGPLVNLILYLIIKDDINLILFFINILPIYPLDGGRIVNLISNKFSKIISLIFLVIVYFLSVYMLMFYKSFSLLLIAVYLTAYSISY